MTDRQIHTQTKRFGPPSQNLELASLALKSLSGLVQNSIKVDFENTFSISSPPVPWVYNGACGFELTSVESAKIEYYGKMGTHICGILPPAAVARVAADVCHHQSAENKLRFNVGG